MHLSLLCKHQHVYAGRDGELTAHIGGIRSGGSAWWKSRNGLGVQMLSHLVQIVLLNWINCANIPSARKAVRCLESAGALIRDFGGTRLIKKGMLSSPHPKSLKLLSEDRETKSWDYTYCLSSLCCII